MVKQNKRKDFKICSMDLESVTFNEETGEDKDKVDLFGFYFEGNYFHFSNVDSFFNHIEENIKKYNNYTCYAHNGGGYDFLYLLRCNTHHKNNLKINVTINGRITDLHYVKQIGKKKYKLIFRDSYKILTSSLKKLGASFGFPKTEMPSWLENKKEDITFEEHYKMSIEYNKNDCVILEKILKKFYNDETFKYLKTMPLTISSLALRTFKHMNTIPRLYKMSNASFYDEYLRRSYSGGRVEVFKTKIDEDYTYLDFNSLYPSQMLKPVPIGPVKMFRNEMGAISSYHDKLEGVYEVEWEAPHLHTPILWERRNMGFSTKLVFGINRSSSYKGKGYYALPELLLAEENGYKIKPKSCCVAFETAPVFKEYVETFTKMKYEGGAKREIAKLLLNSLYGKTGQRLEVDTTSTLSDTEAYKKFAEYTMSVKALQKAFNENESDEIIEWWLKKCKNSKIECIDRDLKVYNYKTKKDHRDTNVMWATYITSMARCELWNTCRMCDFEQAYVDTDSCIMPMEFKKKMDIDSKEIGKLKEEGVVHRGRFYAPKSYILDITEQALRHTKVVMKGIDREIISRFNNKEGYIESESYDEIVNKFIPNSEFEVYKVTPYKQSRRMGLLAGEARRIRKKLQLDYDKRLVLDNGLTQPY